MNFLARLLCGLILTGTILTGTVSAGQQEELENLRQRINAMQSEIAKTSESKSEAADALRASELAISDSNRKLAGLAIAQQTANANLDALKLQQQQLNLALSRQQGLLARLLSQQYLGGKHEYLKLLLDNQDPNKVARDLQYLQYIARARTAWLTRLRSDLNALNNVTMEMHAQNAALEKLHAEHADQKEKLKQVQRERLDVLAQVSRQLSEQRREITKLQHDENRLASLVVKIAEMLAKPKVKSMFRNENLPENRFDGKPFEQLKGKLALPVKGEITNRFGATRPDSTVVWKGLFIRTSSGQTVKAIASGRVVFADWMRGFGNLLIVDHGNAYMSLYGNNETLYKQVGDELRGGDIISTAGNSGGNADSGLYFELRHESKPLDPLKWLLKK
ncbi:MAG: peptidoglycan DD-metalloendopeptidase family protein [Gallionella sp.]|nr:peptidoglycan DD-metalloendopeptidase family protein [Gallionella sp.]